MKVKNTENLFLMFLRISTIGLLAFIFLHGNLSAVFGDETFNLNAYTPYPTSVPIVPISPTPTPEANKTVEIKPPDFNFNLPPLANSKAEDQIHELIQNDAKKSYQDTRGPANMSGGFGYSPVFEVYDNFPNFQSLVAQIEEYLGGASDAVVYKTFTYDVHSGNFVTLPDLFVDSVDWKQALGNAVQEELSSLFGETWSDDPNDISTKFLNSFALDNAALRLFFNQCDVGSCAGGIVEVDVPLSDISDILKPEFQPAFQTITGTVSSSGVNQWKRYFMALDHPVTVQGNSSVTQVEILTNSYQMNERWENQNLNITGIFYKGTDPRTKKNGIFFDLSQLDSRSSLQNSFSKLKTYPSSSDGTAVSVTLSGIFTSHQELPDFYNGSDPNGTLTINVLVLDQPINITHGKDKAYGINQIEIEEMGYSLKDDLHGKHVTLKGMLFRRPFDSDQLPFYLISAEPTDWGVDGGIK